MHMPVESNSFCIKYQIEFNDENIQNCIRYLNRANESHKVTIEFIDNAGGSVFDTHALIEAIETTLAEKVILIFKNYAISAAAYLLCYFQTDYNDDKVVIETSPNLCCVYHRPRITNEKGIHFANSIDPDENEAFEIYLIVMSYCFDVVFNKLVKAFFPDDKNYAELAKKMYNSNGDVAFIL